MNKKDPSERKDYLYKTTVAEWMSKMVEALAKEAGGVANFFRVQILRAWQCRNGEAVLVPLVGGPRPAWVYTACYDHETGQGRAQDYVDNLVAIPHAELAQMKEMHKTYESGFRQYANECSKLRWCLNQLLGGHDQANQLLAELPNGSYPLQISVSQLDPDGIKRVTRLADSECDPFAEMEKWKARALHG
jgi:hypothetical protein